MKISVILPTYNRPEFLFNAARSVLAQTHDDFELIIKEGGAGKGYQTISNLLSDPRIVYIYSHDRGISHAFNIGLKACTGDVIMWANDDDVLLHNALKTISDNIKEYQWGYGRIEFIRDGRANGGMGRAGTLSELLHGNFIPQPSVFWTRKAFEEVGYMNESYKYAQDYDYWIRLWKIYQPLYIDKVLASYTLHDGQILHNFSGEQTETARKIAQNA